MAVNFFNLGQSDVYLRGSRRSSETEQAEYVESNLATLT